MSSGGGGGGGGGDDDERDHAVDKDKDKVAAVDKDKDKVAAIAIGTDKVAAIAIGTGVNAHKPQRSERSGSWSGSSGIGTSSALPVPRRDNNNNNGVSNNNNNGVSNNNSSSSHSNNNKNGEGGASPIRVITTMPKIEPVLRKERVRSLGSVDDVQFDLSKFRVNPNYNIPGFVKYMYYLKNMGNNTQVVKNALMKRPWWQEYKPQFTLSETTTRAGRKGSGSGDAIESDTLWGDESGGTGTGGHSPIGQSGGVKVRRIIYIHILC